MKHALKKTSFEHILLLVILIVALIIRLWGCGDFSYSNDELSALSRTNFESLSQLIDEGVKSGDTHPPGAQIFLYYWSKAIGTSEIGIRLPFILAGILSIFLAFKLCERAFNSMTGLIVASFMAVSQYFVYYSQLARPYALGWLFCSLFVYLWYKVVFEKNTKIATLALLAISGILGCYMHHFALFFIGLVVLSGLLFIKSGYKYYFITIAAIAIGYLPNLPILLFQLKTVNVGVWLHPSDRYFLGDFLAYLTNFSFPFLMVIGLFLCINLLRSRRLNPAKKKLAWLFAIWFIVIYVIGHLFSNIYTAVLQPSTLIFCFPFLLIAIFSTTDNWEPKYAALFVIVILLSGTTSLIFSREHTKLFNNQGFEATAQTIIAAKEAGTSPKIYVQLNRKEYLDFYLPEQYQSDVLTTDFDSLELFDWVSYVETTKDSNLILAWCNNMPRPEFLQVALVNFPYVVDFKIGPGYECYFLSKEKPADYELPFFMRPFYASSGVYKDKFWDEIADTIWQYGPDEWPSYKVFPDIEFVPIVRMDAKAFPKEGNTIIDLNVGALSVGEDKHPSIVMTIENKIGKTLYYRSIPFDSFAANNAWDMIYFSNLLTQEQLRNGAHVIKFYLWNKDRQEFHFNTVKVKIRHGNPYLYAQLEKVPNWADRVLGKD